MGHVCSATGSTTHLQAMGANTPASILACLVRASWEEGVPLASWGTQGQVALSTSNQEVLDRAWAEKGFSPLQPGRLKKVQGIGWYLDEKNLAQVSTNLLDFEVTGLHTVYEETCREAQVSRMGAPPGWEVPPGEQGGVPTTLLGVLMPSLPGLTLANLCRN